MSRALHPDADLGRLIDAARRHAAQLREDAIDDFWNRAGGAGHRAIRASVRLAASMARHVRLRAQPERNDLREAAGMARP